MLVVCVGVWLSVWRVVSQRVSRGEMGKLKRCRGIFPGLRICVGFMEEIVTVAFVGEAGSHYRMCLEAAIFCLSTCLPVHLFVCLFHLPFGRALRGLS